MTFNDKIYDVLKYIARYVLPALGTLYFALASIWGLPYGEQIIGTIAAVTTFLSVLLGISSASYNGDGTLTYNEATDESAPAFRMDISKDLDELMKKDTVILKVNREE